MWFSLGLKTRPISMAIPRSLFIVNNKAILWVWSKTTVARTQRRMHLLGRIGSRLGKCPHSVRLWAVCWHSLGSVEAGHAMLLADGDGDWGCSPAQGGLREVGASCREIHGAQHILIVMITPTDHVITVHGTPSLDKACCVCLPVLRGSKMVDKSMFLAFLLPRLKRMMLSPLPPLVSSALLPLGRGLVSFQFLMRDGDCQSTARPRGRMKGLSWGVGRLKEPWHGRDKLH